jgi:hypothetical protein
MKKRSVIRDYSKERVEELTTFGKLFFKNPISKFILLIVLYLVLSRLISRYYYDYNVKIILYIVQGLIAVFFIVVIYHLLRLWFSHVNSPKNIPRIIANYLLFIFAIILIFSTILSVLESYNLGYIKYAPCENYINYKDVHEDSSLSKNYFYFTAITFFTVRYGDICPMGYARELSILISLTGHLISVLIVALIINNYYKKKENPLEQEKLKYNKLFYRIP